MYIDPFLAGVLVTIGVELALIITASMIAYFRSGKKRESEFDADKRRVKADIERTRRKMEESV